MFAALDLGVQERFLDLEQTDIRVRVLSYGHGPPLLLLHGVSLMAAAWAPLFAELHGFQLLAVDLPGHGLSDPVRYQRGGVREHARRADRRHPQRTRTGSSSGRRSLARRDVRPMARGCFRADPVGDRCRGAGGRAAGSQGADAFVAAHRARPRSGCPAFSEPPRRYRRLLADGLGAAEVKGSTGPAARRAALVCAAAGERPDRGLADARDRSAPPPKTQSVLTPAELAAIAMPTVFILGSDDPYLSPQDARQSIETIPTAAGSMRWMRGARPVAGRPRACRRT